MERMLERILKQEEEEGSNNGKMEEQNVQFLNATIKIPVFYSTRNVIPESIRFGESNIEVDPNFELGRLNSSLYQGPSTSGSFTGRSLTNDSSWNDNLTNCIKNGKLDVISAGQLLINFGGPSDQIIDEFVAQNYSKITGALTTSSILDPNCSHALQIGNFIMVQVNSKKLENMGKVATRQTNVQQNIDLGPIMGSLTNLRNIFEITNDPPFYQVQIDLRCFDPPKKGLKQHIIMRDYLYQILTILTFPAEAIKNYTYRDNPRNFSNNGGNCDDNQESDSEENEEHSEDGSNNMPRGRFKDLPDHIVKVLLNLFFEYFGFNSPMYTTSPDDLETDIEFMCLGNTFEERFNALRERRQILNNFTSATFPSMLKNAFCEIRLSTVENNDGKIVWSKRKRVAGFRQLTNNKRKSAAAGSSEKRVRK
ncbi:unnamed protein product [Caenorhabditis angaria]|uniref:Uncharacterized protein n=1 Tax=Caenorhabditis angaria TaxID=860376 RepID=A0A9P1ITE5_9PELO|nr:unnamed protein product [Caenorhabditis angaria]